MSPISMGPNPILALDGRSVSIIQGRLDGQGGVDGMMRAARAAPFAPVANDNRVDRASFDDVARAAGGDALGNAPSESLGRKFEAAMLTPFMASMLPDADNPVWGGSAGAMWRGLFAEHVAASVAETGEIGVAQIIDRMLDDRAGDIG
ncbi:rod-binding protein [Acuticoccus sp. M5D2P5]|uniref:rod-binding protein n=1 Tax=Acuticoccus kalidii TaxID=2910977 RepID=UPI001F266461|nr:rod-binding protein [Acuticoccus kalidii]MCF3932494.1 rod-binding protein [Acuticoccus kalidii]